MTLTKTCAAIGAVAVMLTVAGCGDLAGYDERMDYLKTMATRGVEMHNLIDSQEGKPDKKRCKAAFDGVSDYIIEAPHVHVDERKAWHGQVEQVFVDSCVSGVPEKANAPGGTQSPSETPTDDS